MGNFYEPQRIIGSFEENSFPVMVKYCAVALCRNGSKKRPDLTYFSFPLSLKDRKKWEVFCKRGDKKFYTLSDPRISSVHFKKTDIETSISGRKNVRSGCHPTIFDPVTSKKTNSPLARRLDNRKRRSREDDQSHAKKFCAKNLNLKDTTENCVKWSTNVTAVQHDHSYFCNREQTTPVEKMLGELPEGKSSVATQTDLRVEEIDYLVSEVEECRRN